MSFTKLYKFRTVNSNNLEALSSNHLWFSDLGDFNDPFEGSYILDNDLTKEDEELLKKAIQKKPINNRAAQREYEETLKKIGIDLKNNTAEELNLAIVKHKLQSLIDIIHSIKCISMSLKDDKIDPIYQNLLWSHYSDGLRGFCLVFNKEFLMNNFYTSTEDAIRGINISYQDLPNKLKISEYIRSKSFVGELDHSTIQRVTDTIATKSTHWLYENEIRFLSTSSSNLHSYKPDNLVEIVIGEKMSQSQQKSITEIVKTVNPSIVVKKARITPGTYNIDITAD